ncbi:hypothetical protein BC938DRAFT_473159 [Jimgerdemannia flammicorona]|uniref:RRM domain-containing protein n=1 Tax=Jimgerdemannia flammicorona TaxID=994334 RepID=A0A433QZT2_9FUNG|nr:hypothetical protein BC938DRAFT_473159 [Jimgerdemannia flammicorona]
MSLAARGSRVVFVGNIPYELTEEQLVDVFKEAGPVVSFRLVFDRDTGRPKGYGFCEYHDAETAASAVRNLNNYDVGGRQLRVDYAEADPMIEAARAQEQAGYGSSGPSQPRSAQPVYQQQQQPQPQQQAPLQHQPAPQALPTAAPQVQGQSAMDAITKTLAAMNPTQLFELMTQMKQSGSSARPSCKPAPASLRSVPGHDHDGHCGPRGRPAHPRPADRGPPATTATPATPPTPAAAAHPGCLRRCVSPAAHRRRLHADRTRAAGAAYHAAPGADDGGGGVE